MDRGLITYGSELQITQIPEPRFKSEFDAYVGVNNRFNAARSARQTASDLFKPADTALSEWLQTTRNVLAGRFGSRWSTSWAQAGFVNATTSVPTRIKGRLALALSLDGFFTSNPSFEVPTMLVTAAQAKLLRKNAVDTQAALAVAEIALKNAGTDYDSAYSILADTMYSLIKILEGTLADSDPRWLAFGLLMPSMDATPGKPTGLSAHLDDMGNIIVQCDPTPLATRYRWRGLILGVETSPRLVARSIEPMASVPGVLPGQTMELFVQAVNNGLQGVASDPVQITLPLVAERKAEAPADSSRTDATTTAGSANGNRVHRPENGHRPAIA